MGDLTLHKLEERERAQALREPKRLLFDGTYGFVLTRIVMQGGVQPVATFDPELELKHFSSID